MRKTADRARAGVQGEIEFRILGPLEVLDHGRLLPLGGAKQRALLAILLINANEVVPTDRLIELLWRDGSPSTANNVLQVYISHLRKLLEPRHSRINLYQVLVSQPPGYLLHVESGQLDLNRFERLVEGGRLAMARKDPVAAAGSLRSALALWRGPALADVSREPFAVAEVARLTEMRLQALEERIDADLALGHHADTVGELQALVLERPMRERLCAQLMLALYRSGRQAEASDLYQRTRQAMVAELGMEPGPTLQQLLKQIVNQDRALDIASPPLRGESGRSNLPIQLTRLVGREREVDEVKKLLAGSKLMTLTGAGGIGKTRLAIEVASQLVKRYRDGVWLVDFAPVADQNLVAKTVMYALGLRTHGGSSDAEILIGYLKGRRQLLLLDNCEHLIEGAARLVDTLLRACPDLQILATSREAIGVSGEITLRVPSLSTPDPNRRISIQVLLEFEAVSLFCDCARRALGTFTVTEANATAVASMCHRLDGIPLAIELAASRLRLLSVNELNERLTDSYMVLVGGGRTVGRHQTLKSAIDWSYELLDTSERALFRRLSVFAGGFTVSAAEDIYGPHPIGVSVLDLLARLVDKSMVLPADTIHGQGRLRMLEVLRQFGHERLADNSEVTTTHDRHLDYCTALAEGWSQKLRGPELAIGLDRLEGEHDNIRAAFAWGHANGRADSSIRLLAAVWLFWYLRGYGMEGLRRATDVLAQFEVTHSSRIEALFGTAKLAWQQRDLPTAERLAAEALSLSERSRDSNGRGLALLCLGNNKLFEGKLDEAELKYSEALILLRTSSNDWAASIVLNNLGNIACDSGRYSDAERYLTESLELSLRVADPWRKEMALGTLGELYLNRGASGRAAEVIAQCLALQREVHNIFTLPFELELCARLAVTLTEPERALRLAGAADGVRRRFGSRSQPQAENDIQRAMEAAERRIDTKVVNAAWQQGQEMTSDEAVA